MQYPKDLVRGIHVFPESFIHFGDIMRDPGKNLRIFQACCLEFFVRSVKLQVRSNLKQIQRAHDQKSVIKVGGEGNQGHTLNAASKVSKLLSFAWTSWEIVV